MVDGLNGLVEVVALDCVADCPRGAVEARDYPAVVQRPTLALAFKPAAHLRALGVKQTEARGVPDFVGEVSIGLNLVVAPARVGRADCGEDEASGVNAVLVEHVERVNAVALRLRHALPGTV